MRTAQDHDHLSYSQVNTYLSCPLQYRFKYIDEIPPAFTSVALAFGSAIHEAVAAFYQISLEGDQLKRIRCWMSTETSGGGLIYQILQRRQ